MFYDYDYVNNAGMPSRKINPLQKSNKKTLQEKY